MNDGPRDPADERSLTRDLHVEATYRLTEALVASENRMRRRIDLLSEVVFEADETGALVFLNRAWEVLTGGDPDRALGHRLTEFVHPADRAEVSALLTRATSEPLRLTTRLERADGGKVWVTLVTAAIPDGYVGVLHDTTIDREAQEEVAKLSLVASETDNLVVITDDGGFTEWVNPAFERRTQFRLAEIRGQKPGQFLQGPGTDPLAIARLGDAVRRQVPAKEEILNYAKDGTPYWVSLHIAPVTGPDGKVTHFISVQTDTTERKLYEERILEQNAALESRVEARTFELARAKEAAEGATRAKSAFIANMSHEIRTPLSAIVGLAHLLEETDLDPTQRAYLSDARIAAQSLVRLLTHVLDFARFEAGAVALVPEPFDLARVLETVDAVVGTLAREKDIEFSIDCPDDVPPHLVGDSVRLEEVLLNLAGNAVKFTEEGNVRLSVRLVGRDRGTAEIEFETVDTGIGIGPDQLDAIFQAFSQGDSSRSRRYGGAGLGLAISDRIVREMGGAISVHSTLGLGSRFAFRIHFALAEGRPCTTEAGPVGSASAAGESALVGTRILVAEDDPLNRSVVVALLSSVGARVTAVSSGAEVLEHLTGNECDLVVMDIQMPGMDGLETTRRIRSESSIGAIPVVALTANTRTEDRLACADAGMTGFAAKPIEPTTLLETLLTVLSRSTAAVGAPPEVVGSNGVEAVIDPSTAPRLLNNDAGLVARTYDLFVRSARMTLGEMEQALAVGDMRALGHLAHRLRGSSATIGSIPMAECCSDLEAASRISNHDTASRLLDRLRELAGLVTEELLALNRR